MKAGALARHKIEVVEQFAELPALSLDRHRVLQTLNEMGGSLDGHSDGSGQGAKSILDVPIGTPEGPQ